MTLQIIVTNVWSRMRGLNNIQTSDALDRHLSFYVEGYMFTKAYKQGYFDQKRGTFIHWDGRKHLLTQKMVFPTGLLEKTIKFLKKRGEDVEILDQRKDVKLGKEIKIKNFTPRKYQQDALDVAIKKGRGIIRIGTGGGKTLLSSMITASYNVPTIIYVVGKDLLYQFHGQMEKALGIKVGMIGDGHCDIKKINVCSVWTAITAFDIKGKVSLDDEDWSPEIKSVEKSDKLKIKKMIQECNLSIFDEAHFLATNTLQSIFKASKKCNFLFGLSGTDWRDDGADLLLESVCGERIFNMPSSKLIEQEFLVPPKIALMEVPPYHEDLPPHYASIYSKYIVKNDIRNGMVEDSARMLIKMGKKVLILVRNLSHGRELAKKLNDIPLYFVNGEVSGEMRNTVKEDFEEGGLKCLIASSVFDIGIDIPKLDALILGGGGKSTVRTLQRIGRVIRLSEGKKDAIVVDFIDNAKYLDSHSATRIATYETEKRFIIKFPKDFDKSLLKSANKIVKKIK